MYLFSSYDVSSHYTPHRDPLLYVVWASATIAAAWLIHRTDYCAFLLERLELRWYIPSHMYAAIVMWPLISAITDALLATV